MITVLVLGMTGMRVYRAEVWIVFHKAPALINKCHFMNDINTR